MSATASPAWEWTVVLGSLAFFALAVALPWVRGDGVFRWRFVPAVGITSLGLWLLGAPPHRDLTLSSSSAVLVTAGADVQSLPEAMEQRRVYRLPGAPDVEGDPAPTARAVAARHPEVREWRVVGAGLPGSDLAALPGRVVAETSPSKRRAGWEEVDWPRRVVLGAPLRVSGIAPDGFDRVCLLAPGGSEVCDAAPEGRFVLEASPRLSGRHRYWMAIDDPNSPASARLPVDVEVVDPDVPSVLWLADAPGFEARHVRNWWIEAGGGWVERLRVSDGRYRYGSWNGPAEASEQAVASALGSADLVVVEAYSGSPLRRGESARIKEALAAGTGLLLLGDHEGSGLDELAARFATEPLADLERVEREFLVPGSGELPALEVPARVLEPTAAVRPLIEDAAGSAWAGALPVGNGRAAVSLVPATYRWLLRGEATAFAGFWSHLVTSLARRPERSIDLPRGPLPVGAPIEIGLLAPEPTMRLETPSGTIDLAPRRDRLDGRRWSVTWAPLEEGWHRVESGAASIAFRAVEDEASIAVVRSRATDALALRTLLDATRASGPDEVAEPVVVRRPLSPWIGWLLLVAGLAFLWAGDLFVQPLGSNSVR